MANYMKQRAAFISAGFQAGLQAGRQQILDMMSLVLRDPEIMGKDIFGKDRLLKVVIGIDEYIGKYQKAWEKDDETDYIRAKLDAALAEGWRTADLWHEGFKKANTEDMTRAVLAHI